MATQAGSPKQTASNLDARDSPDDVVIPFQTEKLATLGRLVRLGPAVDKILARHNYPDPISHVLGEAVALTAMLGSTLKFEGRLILQASTDGPLRLLVVNYESPGRLRAYASYDEERVSKISEQPDQETVNVIGHGHLAMTIDPGGEMDRYQGIVPLEGTSLSNAALTYFRQSEQLPTFIRLAVARQYTPSSGSTSDEWIWRAGGLMIQNVSMEGGAAQADNPKNKSTPPTTSTQENEEPAERLIGEDDDDWQRARILASTVEDHELLDPTLPPERLLYRLFHEEGVRVNRPRNIEEHCRCSRDQIFSFLKSFDENEMAGLREADGAVTVKCEFCSKAYRFEPTDLKKSGE